MKSRILKDKKKRSLYKKYESPRVEYKSVLKDCSLPKESIYNSVNLLNKTPRNASKTRIRDRCVLTGRGRGNLSFYRLSRISFQRLAARGLLPGVTKSSW